MGLTPQDFLDKLPMDQKRPLAEALQEIVSSGFGQVTVKVQDGKIVFVQATKNFK